MSPDPWLWPSDSPSQREPNGVEYSDQALIAQNSLSPVVLPSLGETERLPSVVLPDTLPPHLLIIPGSGIATPQPIMRPRPVRRRVHIVLAGLTAFLLVAMLVSVAPLSAGGGGLLNPFSALAHAIALTPPPAFVDYRVQPGDTYETIADHFGVTVNGLYQINNLYAGQEPQVGLVIQISTNSSYGANFTPPPMPVAHIMGKGTGSTNYVGTCMFCSAGGWTNGPGQPCAPASSETPIDPTHFNLLMPEQGSHWVRGFTAYHNGVDLSNGPSGSPLYAAQAGVVIFAGWDPYGAGYAVKINHCGGLATAYGHMQRILVSVGQPVQAGQQIGLQGMTGTATGPHVHFMTWWNNTPFDPLCVYSSMDGVSSSSHYGGCPAPQTMP